MAQMHSGFTDFVLFPHDEHLTSSPQEASIKALLDPQLGMTGASTASRFSLMAAHDFLPSPGLNGYLQPELDFSNGPCLAVEPCSDAMYRHTPVSASPSNSLSHSLDFVPSSISHASTAGQSAASSAIGSPLSQANNSLPGQEAWFDMHRGLGLISGIPYHDMFQPEPCELMPTALAQFPYDGKYASNYVDPTMLQPVEHLGHYGGLYNQFVHNAIRQHHSHVQPASPSPSTTSTRDSISASASLNFASRNVSPYVQPPYGGQPLERRSSAASQGSGQTPGSPRTGSLAYEDDGKERDRCPVPECRRIFKDLKAHMLTHQSERPEKCPITTCEYHIKGFARKYDRCRHTLTHYKGTMVCDFCPGGGSAAEKSFNRADVFKRHLTSVHAVEQTPPNSRKKSPTSTSRKASSQVKSSAGKCSTCSSIFNSAQDFYDHLDECVLKTLEQPEPSEAVNERHLTALDEDKAVRETLGRHMLSTDSPLAGPAVGHEADKEDGEDDEDADFEEGDEEDVDQPDDQDESELVEGSGTDTAWVGSAVTGSRHGRGCIRPNRKESGPSVLHGRGAGHTNGTNGAIVKSGRPLPSHRRGLTRSKGGIPLLGKGRKKRKHYPTSWGCQVDKMKMKKRVLCVYDGPRRLWKDEMMLDNDFQVRMQLDKDGAYVTDLDYHTVNRATALLDATEEEKGPWLPNEEVERLMV